MDHKPGDLVTLRVLEVQRSMIRLQFTDTKRDFWLIFPAEPIKPPTLREWEEGEKRFRQNLPMLRKLNGL